MAAYISVYIRFIRKKHRQTATRKHEQKP